MGDNGYHNEKQIKKRTFFSLYGKVWGYDISLFNTYNETEILLEPERKFRVENLISDANDIIVVTCEIIDSPIVLNDLKEKIVNPGYIPDILFKPNPSQIQKKCIQYLYDKYKDKDNILEIFKSIMWLLDYIQEAGLIYDYDYKKYSGKIKSELFQVLVNDIKLFEDKYFGFIEKYGNDFFLEYFREKQIFSILKQFTKGNETNINEIISMILKIIHGEKPHYHLFELINITETNKYINPNKPMNKIIKSLQKETEKNCLGSNFSEEVQYYK